MIVGFFPIIGTVGYTHSRALVRVCMFYSFVNYIQPVVVAVIVFVSLCGAGGVWSRSHLSVRAFVLPCCLY